jgi:hypothetical protein
MTGQGALSIREMARQAGRDVKAVHGDITSLINAGVLARTGDRVIFPYDCGAWRFHAESGGLTPGAATSRRSVRQ